MQLINIYPVTYLGLRLSTAARPKYKKCFFFVVLTK